ncbi:MAG: hypothetical protein IKD45_05040 [Clostridia bacterium]|nr:hypothetical protein [Clostridia bacterium]
MKKRIIALLLCIVMCFSVMSALASCGGNKKPDAFVIMTEALDGLFNPFFSTTAADGTIVGMTQIGMLGTDYVDGKIQLAVGDDHAVVTKAFKSEYNDVSDTTTYTFVIKNGIKYSDGEALNIEDVLFNLYVYLDPVYTGSSTMYSTKILGLSNYRTQTISDDTEGGDSSITESANILVADRLNELINLFKATGKQGSQGSYSATEAQMKEAILAHSLSDGYKAAVSNDPSKVTNQSLLDDYNLVIKFFKEELANDYISAQEAYTESPYKEHEEFLDPIFCFMCYEGKVEIEYELDENNKPDKSKIKEVKGTYGDITDKDKAIDYVYNSTISSSLDRIVTGWATAQKLQTEFFAKAKEVILHQNMSETGKLAVENIEGIVSLGHTENAPATVTIDGVDYKVAKEHDENGSPKNADEYDVLEITIDGVDPKAVWNFAFTVAPQHYYAKGYDVDIASNNFGVDFASYDYMTKVIQSPQNIKVPMGAGPYKASNEDNGDNPEGTAFFSDNVVYFKANNYFETVAANINNPKIEKIRYQVVSSSNALNALETGAVHYVTPQLTDDNINKINAMASKGIESTYTDQLGYGYIGINAGKVENIYLRRAIMSAMNTHLALSYYRTGTAETIYWPMSTVSWAYPKAEDGSNSRDNGKDYPVLNFNDETAKEKIREYMEAAGVSEGDDDLKIRFTIAGSNLVDHPSYNTLQKAADLLNECGWEIEVVADTQALTKLSTGSLAVWAAAWGSAIDPDMYQVYHKNSTASSVLAWGYREILANPDLYAEENDILDELSDLIDEARETDDQAQRTDLYERAMQYVLDLAIELPVYQRSTLYAYNTNVISKDSIPAKEELNPYTSPIDKIWEIEFAD